MLINRSLSSSNPIQSPGQEEKKESSPLTYKQVLRSITRSKTLLFIAVLVVGFGMTNNLIEVIWKQKIRDIYSTPRAYNAYINQITSIIGILSVVNALLSRWLLRTFSFRAIALLTPATLFITGLLFFSTQQLPSHYLLSLTNPVNMNPLYFIMTLGSLHYILALTAKYTLFDMCKEIGFLSIDRDKRMQAKAVIDSVGSRLGKSGASLLYQVLLICFVSTQAHLPIIGITAIFMISISMIAAHRLGNSVVQAESKPSPPKHLHLAEPAA